MLDVYSSYAMITHCYETGRSSKSIDSYLYRGGLKLRRNETKLEGEQSNVSCCFTHDTGSRLDRFGVM